eukprot:sb/3466864/
MAHTPPKSENYVIVKILIPVYCAGACIGKDGLEIQRIKTESGSRVKISRNRDLFPRTDERVVLVSGTPDQVLEVIKFVQEKIKNESPPDNRRVNPKRKDQVKLIVAHSAAGRIIGRKGDKVNKLKQDFGVKVYITNKDENIPTLNERVVTIEGSDESVRETARDIINSIQENPEGRLSRSLEYRKFSENPYGAYFYHGPPPPPYHRGGGGGGGGGYSHGGYSGYPPGPASGGGGGGYGGYGYQNYYSPPGGYNEGPYYGGGRGGYQQRGGGYQQRGGRGDHGSRGGPPRPTRRDSGDEEVYSGSRGGLRDFYKDTRPTE